MATSTLTNATTSTAVDAEVSGFHSGEYTWKIEDAQTQLIQEASTPGNLNSPNFRVGSCTCHLRMHIRHEESKWYVFPGFSTILEDSDIVAAGKGKYVLLDAEGGLMKTLPWVFPSVDELRTGTCSRGYPKFAADLVLNPGINRKGKDLYLRVQFHVKGVPLQKVEPNTAATQLLTVLTDLKDTRASVKETYKDEQDNTKESRVPSSFPPRGAGSGTLSFGSSNSAHITMPLVATGEDRDHALEQHMACYQIVLDNPCSRFTWMSNLHSTDPTVAIHIEGSLVAQIPLLRSLREETIVKHLDQSEGSSSTASFEVVAAQTKEHPADEDESRCSTPFNPPAPIYGTACVLMLVEGVVTPQKMFSREPTLAAQTVWVRHLTTCEFKSSQNCLLLDATKPECLQAASYLGHKQVERLVTQWLYGVVLSMLTADDADGMAEASEDIKEIVFDALPADTLKVIVDDLITLLPGDSLHSKILKLPVAIIDQWMDSCNGAISLQSATVPDVACVLKLIDRLPHHPEVQVLHIPKVKGGDLSTEDTVRVLEALDMVLPAMPKLRVLGLSNLVLTIQNINEVGSILSIVRDRLQGVALTISSAFGQPTDRVEAARILFRAIGRMAQLQTLRLEKWDEGIAKAHVAGLTQLKVLLPQLPSTSYIDRMTVEAPGLKFCTVPKF